MQLKQSTIQELGRILKEEYGMELSKSDLEKFAYSLVGYFSILAKAETREKYKAKFGNSPASRIDNAFQKGEDKKTEK